MDLRSPYGREEFYLGQVMWQLSLGGLRSEEAENHVSVTLLSMNRCSFHRPQWDTQWEGTEPPGGHTVGAGDRDGALLGFCE